MEWMEWMDPDLNRSHTRQAVHRPPCSTETKHPKQQPPSPDVAGPTQQWVQGKRHFAFSAAQLRSFACLLCWASFSCATLPLRAVNL